MIGLDLAEQYTKTSDAIRRYLVVRLPELHEVNEALMDSLVSEYMRCVLLDPSCYYSNAARMQILKDAEIKYRGRI